MKTKPIIKSSQYETPISTVPTWVKLKKYVELTGDSAAAVHARRRARKWLDGDQCKIVDEALWVNLPSAIGWIEGWGKVVPV
jgi:hypothetical protein